MTRIGAEAGMMKSKAGGRVSTAGQVKSVESGLEVIKQLAPKQAVRGVGEGKRK